MKQDCRIEPCGRTETSFDITLPENPGRYTLEAELLGGDGQPVHRMRELQVAK